MAMASLACIASLLISLMWLAEARIPGVYTGGAWQGAHATFYGGSDASGTMGMLPNLTPLLKFLIFSGPHFRIPDSGHRTHQR